MNKSIGELLREYRQRYTGSDLRQALLALVARLDEERHPDLRALVLIAIAEFEAAYNDQNALELFLRAGKIIEEVIDPVAAEGLIDVLLLRSNRAGIFDLSLTQQCIRHLRILAVQQGANARNN